MELEKCLTDGIGGDGCFGDNNDLLGKKGWTARTLSNAVNDVINGPGPNHDLFGRNGWLGTQLENVRKDFEEGPGRNHDIVGKDGWVCESLLGGC